MTAGFYIHIPFCEKRCGYCDFYTVAQQNAQIPAFLLALKKEIALYSEAASVRDLEFATLYFGGGTPSLLAAKDLRSLIDYVFSNFNFSLQPEVTVETNPGTVDLPKLSAYLDAGVNRLSVGIQSFQPDELKILERIHSADEAFKTIEFARVAGFENISLDLIYALPSQALATWQNNLQQAVDLNPEHISAYSLTFEPGTPFTQKLHQGIVHRAPEEIEKKMYLFTMEFLNAKGYFQYEVSNYAKPALHSLHNQKYWDGSPYLGLGPSAHSFIQNKRFWNVRNLVKYQDCLEKGRLPVAEEEQVDSETRCFERIFLGLRQVHGLHLPSFEAEFGTSFLKKHLQPLSKFFVQPLQDDQLILDLTDGKLKMQSDLMEIENGFIRLTRKGFLLSDAICAEFCSN